MQKYRNYADNFNKIPEMSETFYPEYPKILIQVICCNWRPHVTVILGQELCGCLIVWLSELRADPAKCLNDALSHCIQLFQLRLPKLEQSGKVEYERERLLGIANKLMNFQLFKLVFDFSALLVAVDKLNWNTVAVYTCDHNCW